jgi:COMPASS component SDC1
MTTADYSRYSAGTLIWFARRNGVQCTTKRRTKPLVIENLITERSFTQAEFDAFWTRPENKDHAKNPRNRMTGEDESDGDDEEEEDEEEEDEEEVEEPFPVPSRRSSRNSLHSSAPAQQAPTQPILQAPSQPTPQAPTQPVLQTAVQSALQQITQPLLHGSPTRVLLNSRVTPHVLEGIKHVATNEPEKPLKWLSEFLARKSEELE